MNALVAPIVLAVTAMISVPAGFSEVPGGTLFNPPPPRSILTGLPRLWRRDREYLGIDLRGFDGVTEPREPIGAVRNFRANGYDVLIDEKTTICHRAIPAWKISYREPFGMGTLDGMVLYANIGNESYSISYVRPTGTDAPDAETFALEFCGYSPDELRILESHG